MLTLLLPTTITSATIIEARPNVDFVCYDVHKVGLDIDSLGAFAAKAGFCDLKRVEKFDIFEDSSNFRIKETLVSLNVIITK
jgi:predicted SAM-dependent methyltransferase